MIRSLADLDAVQDGEFVIITLNMLSKYRKQIKRHIRIRGRNVCLVFDESDEMTNPDSKRTKAVLDCFRRVRFKLAMTGTVTRNNISECAPQLELLYNNSYNMLSWADTLYYFEKGDGGEGFLSCTNNPYYGKPISLDTLCLLSLICRRRSQFSEWVRNHRTSSTRRRWINCCPMRSSPGRLRKSQARRSEGFIKSQFHSPLRSVRCTKRP